MRDSLLNVAQVKAATSLSRTSIYRLMAAGKFPTTVDCGVAGRIAWRKSEIENWIAGRRGVDAPAHTSDLDQAVRDLAEIGFSPEQAGRVLRAFTGGLKNGVGLGAEGSRELLVNLHEGVPITAPTESN